MVARINQRTKRPLIISHFKDLVDLLIKHTLMINIFLLRITQNLVLQRSRTNAQSSNR